MAVDIFWKSCVFSLVSRGSGPRQRRTISFPGAALARRIGKRLGVSKFSSKGKRTHEAKKLTQSYIGRLESVEHAGRLQVKQPLCVDTTCVEGKEEIRACLQ